MYDGKGEKLIPINKFWLDFLKHILKEKRIDNFLSQEFIYAYNTQTEMVLQFLKIVSKFMS